jgi:curli biogenesis system outer membrane secretion channel CsgG
MQNLRSAILASVALGTVLCCGGCDSTGLFNWPTDNTLVKPTVAVMKFENHAGASPNGWDLGNGMADILVDRLVASGRYQVLERAELHSLKEEFKLQHDGQTRPQNRAAAGRMKNVQYLIKGTVTDFNPVSSGTGWAGTGGWDIFGGGNHAVMGIIVYVVDVESGQIICSESIEESVRAGDMSSQASYKGVGFGGSQFHQTPLGRATASVIDKAVRKITHTIAAQPWEPKLAMIGQDHTVVINGGQDRRVQAGEYYDVLQTGEAILDPDTGDIIGRRGGKVVGRVQINSVELLCSQAAIVMGQSETFQVGQRCKLVRP